MMSVRAWPYMLAAAALAFGIWRAYAWAVAIGETRCELRHAKAAESAAKEVDRREVASGQATDSMLQFLAVQLPPIEVKTHETVERIRTIYRDRPVPAGCVRPDGVQEELDAARERANSAAGRL